MPPRKLLLVVAEDWFFWTHRLTLARMTREAGYDVSVATRPGRYADAIDAEGFRRLPLRLRRGLANPAADVLAIAELVSLYRRERPDLVHHVSLKPALFGSIAARVAGVPATVNAITGLGLLFADDSGAKRLLGRCALAALRWATAGRGSWTLVQNGDDLAILTRYGAAVPERSELIGGAGVDLERFRPTAEPHGTPRAALVARMVGIKGVRELVEAARRLRERGQPPIVVLVGAPDTDNPSAIDEGELNAWVREGVVEWWGHRDDVEKVWADCHIAVAPSQGGEGVPKSLLEAAACGRPLVTTDVSGCRDLVRHDVNGLIVPPRDPVALAEALARLGSSPELRRRLGAAARATVEAAHGDRDVARRTLALYDRVLADSAGRRATSRNS